MPEANQPKRVIGPAGAMAVVAGSMLGIGIFLTPPIVASAVASPTTFVLSWIFGAALALAGATAYGELGAMFPEAGGDYVFLREGLDESTAFAAGWVLFLGIFGGSLASMSVAVCNFQLGFVLEYLTGGDPLDATFLALWGVEISGTQAAAIGVVLLLTLLNVLGTRLSATTQVVLTAVPVVVLFGASLWVLLFADVSAARPAPPGGETTFFGVAHALAAIYFAYAGWNAVAYVAGEVRDPGRNLPIGFFGGTALISVVYLILCLGFLAVLGLGGVADAMEVGSASAEVLGGASWRFVVTVLIAVALLGSLNATVLGGARIAYAMARDGVMTDFFGALSERTGTPARALWLQAAFVALLILSGGFEPLLEMTSIAMLLLATLVVVALFVLRRSRPDAERAYRATGYPVVPLFFAASSVGIMALNVWDAVFPRDRAKAGELETLLPVLGLVAFVLVWAGHRLWRRRRP